MIIIYLKYLPIIFCGTYAFIRIFNLSIAHSTKLYVLLLTYIFLLPLGVCFSRKYVAFLSLFFMVAISVIIHKISCATYDIPINRIITATITGYGISYATYAVSSLLVSVAFIIFYRLWRSSRMRSIPFYISSVPFKTVKARDHFFWRLPL